MSDLIKAFQRLIGKDDGVKVVKDRWGLHMKLNYDLQEVSVPLSVGKKINALSFIHKMVAHDNQEHSDVECLGDLDLSAFTNLRMLDTSYCTLHSINLEANSKIEELKLFSEWWNKDHSTLSEIDISHMPQLRKLFLDNTQLNYIDLTNNLNLETVSIGSNELDEVDVSKNSKIELLNLNKNKLHSLNVSNLKDLEILYISNNNIEDLDVSENILLRRLGVSYNPLTRIDLCNNPHLEKLLVDFTNISSIDSSNNPEQSQLYVANTHITKLDISNNLYLSSIVITNNYVYDEILIPKNYSQQYLPKMIGLQAKSIIELDRS